MSRMKALKTDEELLAVPVTQPVLVELPTGFEPVTSDDDGKDKSADTSVDDGSQRLKDDYEALKAQSARDTARADQAERDAAEARRIASQREREATDALTRSQALENDLITGGLSAAQAELAAAESELERAGEAGDYKAMAKAQSRIGRASAQIVSLESGAAEAAERKVEPKREPEPRRQEIPADFATRVNSNPNLLQAEKDWMIKNETAFKDPDFNKKLEFAYQGAVAKGNLVRGSAAYFDFMERATGLKADPRDDNDNDDERGTAVSAPPSRNERGGDGRPNNGKITLEPEQRALARSLGVTDIEFARQVAVFEVARKSDPEKYR